LLAARGMDCRVLATGILDPELETSLDRVLATVELSARRFQAELGAGRVAEVVDLGVNGVRVTVMPTASSRAERSPDSWGQRAITPHGGDLENLGSQRSWSSAYSRGRSAMPRSPRASAGGSCHHMKTEAMRASARSAASDREDGNPRPSATPGDQ
jgi:hypothetical protein